MNESLEDLIDEVGTAVNHDRMVRILAKEFDGDVYKAAVYLGIYSAFIIKTGLNSQHQETRDISEAVLAIVRDQFEDDLIRIPFPDEGYPEGYYEDEFMIDPEDLK